MSFGWRPGAGRTRPERRASGERRTGTDRRAPVLPVVFNRPSQRPSPMQLKVLGLFAAGMTREQVAAALGIAPGTVATHVANARQRLGAVNITQAVVECYVRGLLVPAGKKRRR